MKLRADEVEQLVDQAIRGEERAFETLLKKARGLIYYCIRRFARDPNHQEECFQDATIELLRRLQLGHYDRSRGAFSTWVVHCLHSRGRQLRRRHRKSRLVFEADHVMESNVDRIDPDGRTPLEDAAYTELREAMEAALSRLEPAHYRMALVFRVVQRASYVEIAERLEARPSDVKNWIKRARVKLRTLLIEEGFDSAEDTS